MPSEEKPDTGPRPDPRVAIPALAHEIDTLRRHDEASPPAPADDAETTPSDPLPAHQPKTIPPP